MQMLITKNIFGAMYASWGVLGFIRGMNAYDYDYKKKLSYRKNTYLYTHKVGNGLFGIVCYMFPVILPITLHKEIYRLEVNVRRLDDAKQGDYYNQLLW
jgi:hypothetical protein